MTQTDIIIDGNLAAGYVVDLPGAPLVAAKTAKGFVMCGFLDIRSANKFGVPAAVVRGVKTVEELLSKPVSDVSLAAESLGVRPGMSGREALGRFF
jgi:uncharacterized protein YunC (DUF1805 family)